VRFGVTRALSLSEKISRSFSLFLALSLSSFGGLAMAAAADGFKPTGLWYGRLSPTEDNPVEFQIRVSKHGKGFAAELINGAAKVSLTGAAWDGEKLTLEMARDDARIVARPKGGDLEGTFVRIVPTGRQEIPFAASRRAPAPTPVRKAGVSVTGRWVVEIARPGSSPERVAAHLKQKGTVVTGTMAAASGAYGPLHGTFDGEQLVLMAFNGVFVYRFSAELLPDGMLAGEFRSGKNPPVDWTASRPAPDGFVVPDSRTMGIR
jgi:hypothetical protein